MQKTLFILNVTHRSLVVCVGADHMIRELLGVAVVSLLAVSCNSAGNSTN